MNLDFLFSDTIAIGHYLILSVILFTIGIAGIFLNKKNLIVILMSIEVILIAVNINFVAFSAYFNDITGQICTVFILTVAAAEASLGLAILVTLYRNIDTIDVNNMNKLKG